jgi:hypothetical protein
VEKTENKNLLYLKPLCFEKSYLLIDNVEKYGTARQLRDCNTIQRTCFASCITKAEHTHTHSLLLFMAATVSRMRVNITFISRLNVLLDIVVI